MDELDRHGRGRQALQVVVAHARGEQDEGGAHTLAASAEEIRHRRRHHLWVAGNRLLQLRLDRREI